MSAQRVVVTKPILQPDGSFYTPLVGETPPGDPRLKPLKGPLDYLSAEAAYKLVSRLTLKGVQNVAAGFPPDPPEAAWGNYGTPTMQLVRAASETLSAMDKGSPKELNDRMDGTVAQRVDVGVRPYVIETPAKVEDAEEWQKLFAPATATIETAE